MRVQNLVPIGSVYSFRVYKPRSNALSFLYLIYYIDIIISNENVVRLKLSASLQVPLVYQVVLRRRVAFEYNNYLYGTFHDAFGWRRRTRIISIPHITPCLRHNVLYFITMTIVHIMNCSSR